MKRTGSALHRDTATITITFGDQAENHVGMQKVGKLAEEGFSIQDLKDAQTKFVEQGTICEFFNLKDALPQSFKGAAEEAAVLVVRDGVDSVLAWRKLFTSDGATESCSTGVLDEQIALDWDTQAKMYGRVVKKTARHNLCYSDEAQEPDYQNGKGRIVSFDQIPLTNSLRKGLKDFVGPKAEDLTAEGNLYYDIKKCGIGFHGDSERKKVIAIRLGESMPLHYQWFQGGCPVGERIIITLNDADLYIMSEKATGNDWKKKKSLTLRHAAGCDKFTTIKPKKPAKKPKAKTTKKKSKASTSSSSSQDDSSS